MGLNKGGRRMAIIVIALAGSPAIAQDNGPDSDRDTVTIGAGAAIVPSYEGSDNYRIIPAGAIRGKVAGFTFQTLGTTLYVDVIPNRTGDVDFQFGPVAGVNLNRTSSIKDARVRALGEIDTAIELGGYVGIGKTGVLTSAYDTISVNVAYQHDVTNTHDSYIITPSINYGTPLSKTAYVGASVNAEIVGDGYAQTYFGVTPGGAIASGLPAYTPDGGIKNVAFTLLGAQSLSGDLRRGWSLFAIGSYSKLLGDFKRSPIVSVAGDSSQWLGAIGIGYTF